MYSQDNNLNFISSYNDIDSISGLATLGFEIEQW